MRVSRILATLCVFGLATMANAQATRTWVSGVGDDVNPCSRTAPCKTFAGAISKTADKGEINVLDAGGFGAVTITKNMTIDGGGSWMASILASGTNGVVVNDSATATPNTIQVVLRNISINGASTGLDGVKFIAGKRLTIEHCRIANFTDNGIDMTTTVANTMLVLNNVTVENTTNVGINLVPTGLGPFLVDITNTLQSRSTASSGVFFNGVIRGNVNNSTFVMNSGAGVTVSSTAKVTLDHVRAVGNGFGVLNSGGTPTTRLKDCTLTGNTTNGALSSSGTMTPFSSNVIENPSGLAASSPLQ